MKYYIITPAKNEEQYIRLTLESMVKQTVKPEKWIIVNDGSTDRTLEIAEEYAAVHPWIQIISLDNKGEQRSYGSKVIRAFNAGYRLITDTDYGFIVKLDADLSFPETYFQQIGEAFAADPKLGLCGGYVLERPEEYEIKKTRFPRVEGALKSVRKACFDDIGGFVEENGWDGLDILMALYKGWEMRNIDVKITHHRPEATAYRSTDFFYKNGITHYRQGNDVWLTLVRGLFFMKKKPYVSASLSYLKGYFGSWVKRKPRLVDKDLARFIRKYHYKRLLNFKR